MDLVELKENFLKEGFVDIGNNQVEYIFDIKGNKAVLRLKSKDIILYFGNELSDTEQDTYLNILKIKIAKAQGEIVENEEKA